MTEREDGGLRAGLEAFGLHPDDGALARLDGYLALLERWSSAFNLVGTRDRGELIRRHVLDCAALVPALPPGALLDVGSGAGLPGLIVALLEPERPVTLLDSSQRKTRFLRQVAIELDLGAVDVVTIRVEDYAPPAALAAVTARALAPLERLLAWTGRLLSEATPLLAMKGPGWREEAEALGADAWTIEATTYRLGAADHEHAILRITPAGVATG